MIMHRLKKNRRLLRTIRLGIKIQ